jgi:hypothetical protein
VRKQGGTVVFKRSKLPCLRKGGLLLILSGFARVTSMTSSERNTLPCSCFWVDLTLYCFPDYAFNVAEFHGQNTGALKLDTLTQVHAVLSMADLSRQYSLMCH